MRFGEQGCPDLKLYLAIPHLEHWGAWRSGRLLNRYWDVRKNADVVRIVTKEPFSVRAMHARNRHMVDLCDVLVAIWNGERNGGTYSCLKYAASRPHVRLLWLNPFTLESKLISGSDVV